jgi:chemotaxis protein methyltransferase CheR
MILRDQQTADFEVKLLLEALYFKYSADFRDYSPASVRRRLELAMKRMGLSTLSQLQDKVLSDPGAYDGLLQFLTVPTSEMFRDPPYFMAMRREVLPNLATYPSLKIWIAGCSTGEEVYSFAILLLEEGLLDRSILYATDINPNSLHAAESGRFPLSSMSRFTENYQRSGGKAAFSDYYKSCGDHASFADSLRKKVVFADHSLATDSVFAEVQLVSCRNVLIYFNRKLQDRAFGLFHSSLTHLGFLGIGAKETVRFSAYSNRFEEFLPEQKIYRRSG